MGAETVSCPSCGSARGLPIVWGLVRTPLAEQGDDVVYGGCIVPFPTPSHQCAACGHEFGRLHPVGADEPIDWDLVADALALALDENVDAVRKDTATPYLAHLLAVAGLVWEHGGTDEQVAAALLHDLAEDHGGEAVLAQLADRFAERPRVAELVRALSDSLVADPERKAPWLQRKVAHLGALSTAPDDVLLVALADELHNARSTVADYRVHGEDLWGRFNAGRAEQLWWHESLATLFVRCRRSDLASELDRTVAELWRLVRESAPGIADEVAAVRARAEALSEVPLPSRSR